ncbi:MAG: L-threonylcarbamoyladenylate synthase, partial [Gemmatimonadota bacterium]|nr:L-threonylcarbamoyladenylate synthase [Gemmatimonadota bacterium]
MIAVDAEAPDPDIIHRAAQILKNGGLVAFPTETVYGLGAHALNAEAVRKIFEAKGRPAWNPLIVHVANADRARALTASWPASAELLANAFWPGPLTLVLPKRDVVPDVVTAGLAAVGVRVPSHGVALALINALDGPIAAPSANRFTELSPTTAQHVQGGLGQRVDMILDGGPCDVGIESTVLDLTTDTPTLLRPGVISHDQIVSVLGRDVRVLQHATDVEGESRLSPGRTERHYAPRADTWLFDAGEFDMVARSMSEFVVRNDGATVAVLVLDWSLPL